MKARPWCSLSAFLHELAGNASASGCQLRWQSLQATPLQCLHSLLLGKPIPATLKLPDRARHVQSIQTTLRSLRAVAERADAAARNFIVVGPVVDGFAPASLVFEFEQLLEQPPHSHTAVFPTLAHEKHHHT